MSHKQLCFTLRRACWRGSEGCVMLINITSSGTTLVAIIQLIIPDEDWNRFVAQARLEERRNVGSFDSSEAAYRFFLERGTIEGPDAEPDWSGHLHVIDQSRAGAKAGP